MEALDNPSYFSMPPEDDRGGGGDSEAGGGPRGRAHTAEAPPRTRSALELLRSRRSSSDTVSLRLEATSPTSSAYYNVTKRHSLATLPRASKARKQVSVVIDKTGKMLDITIVSCSESEDATLWANYLTSCFQEISREENKPPFKLAHVMMENVLLGLPVEGSTGSRLQIVIVCPKFLKVLSNSQGGLPILATMLQPATVLAMLLGVSSQSLDSHQFASLFKFDQWRKMTVKDRDKTFVGDFLGVAMDVLSRSWQLQQAMHQVRVDSSRSHFSITPKKIKVGQNKLLILLNDPLCNSDKINITVDRAGQKVEVVSIKRRNPYTLQFSMPSVCLQTSQLVTVTVERNGRSIGQRLVKCECRLRELDQLLRSTDNPLAFMCQALGINGGDRDQLDSFLVAALQKNIPPNFNLLNAPAASPTSPSREEFPTLLHFAARFGMEKLCWQLLECPGGEVAMQLKNCNGLAPAELAEKHGHPGLAHSLGSYMQMTELSSMYTYMNAYLKNSSSEKSPDLCDANYLLPRPLSDTYLVPPKARPVTPPSPERKCPVRKLPPLNLVDPLENYQSPLGPARPFTPLTPSTPSSPSHPFSHYLHMHSPVSDSSSGNFDSILTPEKKYSSLPGSDSVSIASSGGHHYVNTRCTGSTCSSSTSSKLSPDEELAEIMTDFKNNVYSIGELEKLVEAWKNRNDVQQSFREKKEQINQMRQEYERIQLKIKEQLKRPTPFDRIKKFFSRKSKHEGEHHHHHHHKERCQDGVCHRPVSSLSLHSSCSSSSSGRMSTTSGVSLGDSGTHSDPEEKKPEVIQEKIASQVASPSSAYYERVQRQESLPDEYIPACGKPSPPPPQSPLPQPPTFLRCTVVEVHQSEVLEELTEENSDQTVKTIEELAGRLGSLQSSENSDSSQYYINTPVPEAQEEGKNEDNDASRNEEDLKILEQSERLLKDMANGLPNKEADDILSPPESAFINEDTNVDLDDDSLVELDDPIIDDDQTVQSLNVYRYGDAALTKEEVTTKDKDDDEEVSDDEDTPLLNIIDTASTKDSVVLKDQFNDNLVESVFYNKLHEYVNVSGYLPPPIPPRCKYKNVLL